MKRAAKINIACAAGWLLMRGYPMGLLKEDPCELPKTAAGDLEVRRLEMAYGRIGCRTVRGRRRHLTATWRVGTLTKGERLGCVLPVSLGPPRQISILVAHKL
jgi:hypothetical protein